MKYVIAWQCNVIRYHNGNENGTTLIENADMYDSFQEAKDVITENNWANCYVDTYRPYEAVLLKSNHGNHNGFNRDWFLLETGEEEELKVKRDEMSDEDHHHYYIVITQDDVDNGIFNGGHHGYFPKCLEGIFESN